MPAGIGDRQYSFYTILEIRSFSVRSQTVAVGWLQLLYSLSPLYGSAVVAKKHPQKATCQERFSQFSVNITKYLRLGNI